MHERVKLNSSLGLSSMTAFGVVVSFGILAGMITMGFPMQQYFWAVVILLAMPLYIGSQIDTRTKESEDTSEFEAMGYRELDPDELDTELIEAVARLNPTGTKRHHIKQCFQGTHQAFEVLLMQLMRNIGDTTERYAACAVWSPVEFPQCVVKRRGFLGQVRIDLMKNTHRLGDHHTLETQSDDAQVLFTRLMHWFRLKYSNARHFRLHQPQGLHESWSISGHWIIYADQGAPNHIAFDQLAGFTTSFALDLEQHAASLDVNKHNISTD